MEYLVTQVCALLTAAGIHNTAAFPNFRLPRMIDPMVTVDISENRLLPCALSGYLGQNHGSSVYGMLAELTVRLDVYTSYRSGGSVCADAVQSTLDAVCGGLNDYTLKSIRIDPVAYYEDGDCFRGRIYLHFDALMYQTES